MERENLNNDLKSQALNDAKNIYLENRKLEKERIEKELSSLDWGEVSTVLSSEFEALSSVSDFLSVLDSYVYLMTSSLADNLINNKEEGGLTEQSIRQAFELTAHLIRMANAKGEIYDMVDRSYLRCNKVNNVGINDIATIEP